MGIFVNPFAYSLGGGQGTGGGPDGTQYYVEVTIASSQVASTLTDFPVYVDLSDLPTAFFTNVQSDGGDIRVTESDGTTRCPVDLVSITTGSNTGELHFLASSISSSTDTTFRIYYDGVSTLSQPGVATTYGRNAVWSDYSYSYHLDEDPSGTAPQFVDSTGNGNDATTAGSMTSGDLVTGRLGNGIAFDGTDDCGVVTDSVANDAAANFTVQAWVRMATGASGSDRWLSKFTGGNTGYLFRYESGGVQFLVGDGSSADQVTSSAITADSSTWYMVHGTFTNPATLEVFLNGVSDVSGTGTISGISNASVDLGIGAADNGAESTDGVLDEVRLRDSVLSDDWIASEYTNQNTPTTFYTIGSQTAA